MVLAVSRQFSTKFNRSLGRKLVLSIPQEKEDYQHASFLFRPLGQKMAKSHESEFDARRWPPGGRGHQAARCGEIPYPFPKEGKDGAPAPASEGYAGGEALPLVPGQQRYSCDLSSNSIWRSRSLFSNSLRFRPRAISCLSAGSQIEQSSKHPFTRIPGVGSEVSFWKEKRSWACGETLPSASSNPSPLSSSSTCMRAAARILARSVSRLNTWVGPSCCCTAPRTAALSELNLVCGSTGNKLIDVRPSPSLGVKGFRTTFVKSLLGSRMTLRSIASSL